MQKGFSVPILPVSSGKKIQTASQAFSQSYIKKRELAVSLSNYYNKFVREKRDTYPISVLFRKRERVKYPFNW